MVAKKVSDILEGSSLYYPKLFQLPLCINSSISSGINLINLYMFSLGWWQGRMGEGRGRVRLKMAKIATLIMQLKCHSLYFGAVESQFVIVSFGDCPPVMPLVSLCGAAKNNGTKAWPWSMNSDIISQLEFWFQILIGWLVLYIDFKIYPSSRIYVL